VNDCYSVAALHCCIRII